MRLKMIKTEFARKFQIIVVLDKTAHFSGVVIM